MDATLIWWTVGLVVVVLFLLIAGIVTDRLDPIVSGILTALFGSFLVFGVIGNNVSNIQATYEISDYDVKKYPTHVLISTPQGEQITLTTLSDAHYFETNTKLYRVYRTNHYGKLANSFITIKP